VEQRAATRIKSELMAAIYDKAVRRKDYSGIVEKGRKGDNPKCSCRGKDGLKNVA
jgi:hypothetical protein